MKILKGFGFSLENPTLNIICCATVGHTRHRKTDAWPSLIGLKTLAMTKRNCRLWTEDDDKLLRSMAAAGKSITLMTVKLGRSHQGYQIKSPGIAHRASRRG